MKMARLGFVMLVGLATTTLAATQQSSQTQGPAQSSSQTAQSNTSSSQESPLAAAARRAREERKQQPAAKTARVWDNDNIPTIPANLNVVGPASEATDNSAGAPSADQGAAPAAPADKDAIGKDLGAAKDHLQNLQTDLDLLQRTYTLDQQSYYGKPDYASDPDGATKLKGEQASIDAKQQEIEDAQKKIGDLQSQFNTASAAKPAASSNGGTSGSGSTDTTSPASTPPTSN